MIREEEDEELLGAKDFRTHREDALRRGKLFEDADFPANPRSLYFRGEASPNIVWRRPQEIVRNPVFVNEKATHYDLDQGELGDCWFMAAAATIAATNKKILKRVVPFDQSFVGRNYAGIFRFKFWQYDRWVEVYVDDRLPTYLGRKLIYAYNREEPNEFWAALLEKAYAKLFGCYEAIDGGRVHDAFVDMTGGISEIIDLKKTEFEAKTMYTLLSRTYQMNSLIAGAIFKKSQAPREILQDNGLFQGHAYSLTKLAHIRTGSQSAYIVRLRNPWGRDEWKGEWSDGSSAWNQLTSEQRRQLGVTIEDEGEFWMNVEDFMKQFDEIEFTHLVPDALTAEVAIDTRKKEWQVTTHHDAWIKGVSAGGCGNPPYQAMYWKNPQFRLNLNPQTNGNTVVISLMEVETSRGRNLSIGFDVYQLKPGVREALDGDNYERRALMLKKSSGVFSPYREKTVRFELDPGKYVVIPSTFKPFEESDFMLRLFTEIKSDSSPMDVDNGPIEGESDLEETDLIERLFKKQVGRHGMADPFDLRDILSEAKRREWSQSDGFTLETARSLLTSRDLIRKYGQIDLPNTKKIWDSLNLWKDAFRAYDRNKSGTIDTYELVEVFKVIGLNVNRVVLKSIVRRYGGRRGTMEFEDFVLSSARLISMYRAFRKLAKTGDDTANIRLDTWLETTLYA